MSKLASSSSMRLLTSRAASKLPATRGSARCSICTTTRTTRIQFDGLEYFVQTPTWKQFGSGLLASVFQTLRTSFYNGDDSNTPSAPLAIGLSVSAGGDTLAPSESSLWNWDGLLRAVPKKKVSHSRKAMRSANKGLKDRVGTSFCFTLLYDIL